MRRHLIGSASWPMVKSLGNGDSSRFFIEAREWSQVGCVHQHQRTGVINFNMTAGSFVMVGTARHDFFLPNRTARSMYRLMASFVLVAGLSLVGCGGNEADPKVAAPPPPGQDLQDTDVQMDQTGANAALPPDQRIEGQ